MEIELEILHQISEKIFLSLDKRGIRTINLSVDYYWHIHKDQIYNSYKEPSEVSIGQLSEDFDEINKLLKENREPIGYDLVLLSNLLRAIGEQIVG